MELSASPLRRAVRAAQERVSVERLPFFLALRDGSMSRKAFGLTQLQFLFAVEHFHRPMAVLAERIHNHDARAALARNIADEHGNGDPAAAHEATFSRFLKALGATPNSVRPRRAVLEFNETLDELARSGNPARGLAALGIIEALFATFSGAIGDAVLDHGWLRADELVHYTTHESLDVAHAESFFRPLEAIAHEEPELVPVITEGVQLGATAFESLYNELYRAAEQNA